MGKTDKLLDSCQEIIKFLGGATNVNDVYHCATRMRLTVGNEVDVQVDSLKSLELIKGALWANGELQLIIGPEVSQVTDTFKKLWKQAGEVKTDTSKLIKFATNKKLNQNVGLPIWKRFLKSVSAIFGPLIPFLIGVGLIMAIQQLLSRTGAVTIPDYEKQQLGQDYNLFDYVLDVIASTGFKVMGVIAMWSTVRYIGGKQPTAMAVALIMISPVLMPQVQLFTIGSWEVNIAPYNSTMLVFIMMGVIVAYGQKTMEKYFHPIANFILNPLLTIFIGGMLAFFVMGPVMGVIENAMLVAFDWFMKIPFGIGTMIVGLTWQPLVVLGVHNILFFAAVTAINDGGTSLFLAAAFAAAWAQMGATLGVALKSKKTMDRYGAIAAAVPGVISGPTESCIYAVNLPKGLPFFTGVIAGGVGGLFIGIFGVDLDNLAGLGGIVGFLAYTDDLIAAILIDLGSLALGIVITYFLWSEDKSEKMLALKTLKMFAKTECLIGKNDFSAHKARNIIKKMSSKKHQGELDSLIVELKKVQQEIKTIDNEAVAKIEQIIKNFEQNNIDKNLNKEVVKYLSTITSERQEEANVLFLGLKNEIKTLNKLAPVTKAYAKLVNKKANLEFALKRIQTLQEDHTEKLLRKSEKLINSGQAMMVEKGKAALQEAQSNSWKADKVQQIQGRISEIEALIMQSTAQLGEEVKKYFDSISQKVVAIENGTKQKYPTYQDRLFNDIYDKQIKAELLEPRII